MASILRTRKRSQNGPHSSIIHILCLSAERDGLVRVRRKCSWFQPQCHSTVTFALLLFVVDPYFTLLLQYSEKALYNQLCFYRFIFDWEAAFSKIQADEKSKTHSHKHFLRHYATIFILIIPVQICNSDLELLSQCYCHNSHFSPFKCTVYYSAKSLCQSEIKLVQQFWCSNWVSSKIHTYHRISNQWLNFYKGYTYNIP